MPTDKRERLAIAGISGIVGRFNGTGVDRDGALVEIGKVLGEYRIFAGRGTQVLSAVLRHWLDDDRFNVDQARELLLAAGAPVGIGVVGYQTDQFDNLTITPGTGAGRDTGAQPRSGRSRPRSS